MDLGKTLIGLIAGLAAGAAIGLLLAPEKGSDLREKLNDSLKTVSDDVKQKISDQVDNLKDKRNRLSSDIKTDAEKLHEDFVA